MKVKIFFIVLSILNQTCYCSAPHSGSKDFSALVGTLGSAAWKVGTAAAAFGSIISLGIAARWSYEYATVQESSKPEVRLTKVEKRVGRLGKRFVKKKDFDKEVERVIHTSSSVLVVTPQTGDTIRTLQGLANAQASPNNVSYLSATLQNHEMRLAHIEERARRRLKNSALNMKQAATPVTACSIDVRSIVKSLADKN